MTTPFPPIPLPPPPPHLAIPVSLAADGSLATVDQDSPEEITMSVGMLLGTLPGTRLLIPSYGLPDPTFHPPTAGQVQALAARWEPRAHLTVTASNDDRAAGLAVQVAVRNPR